MAIKEQGNTGLLSFNGIVTEEFLKELRGREGYKKFDEMRRNSPIVGAMLYYHEMAIRKVSWNFASKADDTGEDERVDFLNECRENMSQSWNDFISEVLTFLPFGHSIFYPLYKRTPDNGIVWDAFSPRKQNTVFRWLLNYPNTEGYDASKRNGDILGFVQQAPPTYTLDTIPVDKVILFRTRVEANNPEGVSLLRNAWVPYYYTKNLQAFEAIGFERDTNGMPKIMLPSGASLAENDPNSDASKAAEMVRNIRTDEQGGAVLPFGWDLQLMSGSGKSFADLGKAIERYESRTTMAMLSQFIMLGQNGVGTQALSKDHSNIAEMIVNSVADIIAETFTKQEIPRILKMNGYDPTDICLEHTPAGDTDISLFADFLQKVSDKLTWDASDELWLRQLAGMPEKDEATIQAAMDNKQMQNDMMKQALAQKQQQQPAPQPNDTQSQPAQDGGDMPMMEQNTITLFSGTPADERKRRQAEKAWDEAMQAVFKKQKARVMKAARQMKGM